MLIHNGGSIFHDFQRVIDKDLKTHSYPIDKLLESFECNRPTSELVWKWLASKKDPIQMDMLSSFAPQGSVTRLCEDMDIPILLFTMPGADFWHHFDIAEWNQLGDVSQSCFNTLRIRFIQDNFHFVNMGSAVMHPEIFIKAIALSKPKNFKADVVDFKEMYRPRTRVAIFGKYFKMTHKEYFAKVV